MIDETITFLVKSYYTIFENPIRMEDYPELIWDENSIREHSKGRKIGSVEDIMRSGNLLRRVTFLRKD